MQRKAEIFRALGKRDRPKQAHLISLNNILTLNRNENVGILLRKRSASEAQCCL